MLSPARRRSVAGRLHLLVPLLAAALLLPAAPVGAKDGTYTQIFCADPDTGRGVGSDGMYPAGLRIQRSDHLHFTWSRGDTRCGGAVTSTSGVVLGTHGTSFLVDGPDLGLMLRYEPGPGVTFDSATIWRQSRMGTSWEDYWSIAVNRTWSEDKWAQPQYDHCLSRWTEDCRGRGTSDPWSAANRVGIGRSAEVDDRGRPFNGFNLTLRCAAGGCPADPGDFLRVYGGRLTLKDPTAPRLSSDLQGTLVADRALAGVVAATFDATDTGSGVYRTRVVVDGVARPWQTAHVNGGVCADLNAADGDPYEFSTSTPCRTSVNTGVQLDTRTVADGTRVVQVQLEDAAGNLATVAHREIVVDNIPAPTAKVAPSATGLARDGETLGFTPGTWETHGAPSKLVVTRRWERCEDGDEASCEPIETVPPVLDDADVGRRLRVVETAVNGEGTTVRASAMTDAVVDVPAPTSTGLPEVLGGTRRGGVLVAAPGAWDDHEAPGDPTIALQWQRCRYDGTACADVPGADGMEYTLGTDDLNRRLQVVEIARNAEGAGRAASGQTAAVTREDGTLPHDNNGADDDGDGVVDEPGETPPTGGSGTGGSGAGGTPGGGTPGGSDGGKDGTDGRDGSDGSTTASTHTASSVSSHSASVTVAGRNGDNASPHARLDVSFRDADSASMTVRYGKGAAVVGRLVDEAGRPIAGAAIEVTQVAAVRGAVATPRPGVVTGADGRFAYDLDRRSASGTVRFAYSHVRGERPVAVDDLDLRVRATAKLSVKLRGIVASYRGRVLSGPVPRGKLVVVQGRVKGGTWQTFASRRTKAGGRFSGRYRLKLRVPGRRLQFRARVVAESGFPYLTAHSRTVTRTVR